MAKKEKKPSFLAPKRILTPAEYTRYREERKIIEREKLLARMEERRRKIKPLVKQRAYAESKFGKVSRAIGTGLRFIQSPTGVLQERATSPIPSLSSRKPPKTLRKGINYKPGRPKGTYDLRYARWGGVYGWRKAQALERFKQRQEFLRQRAITPQQQQVLAQIEARQMVQRQSPETKTIPDTYGEVPLNDIFSEVDAAAGAVA